MTDVVVTVPRKMWEDWIAEGDAVGDPATGEEWGFFLGWQRPPVKPGDRCYIVAHDRVRGYAPITRVGFFPEFCPEHTGGGIDSIGLGVRAALIDCDICRGVIDGIDDRPRINGNLLQGRWAIGRKGGAVAVTILDRVAGFRGFKRRWWDRGQEVPFPTWRTSDLWLDRERAKAKRDALREAKRERAAELAALPDPQTNLFGD